MQTELVQDYTSYPDPLSGGFIYFNNLPGDVYLTDPSMFLSYQTNMYFNNMLSSCDALFISGSEAAFFGSGPFGDAISKAMGYLGLVGVGASLGCQ